MKISVTQRHINSGKPNKCGLCPVALAAKEQLLNTLAIEVGIYSFHVLRTGSPPREFHAPLPQEAVEFIRLFDERGVSAVRPFSFDLNIPEWARKEQAAQ